MINGRVQSFQAGETFDLDPKGPKHKFKIEQLTGTNPPMIEEVRVPKPMTKRQLAAAVKEEEKLAAEAEKNGDNKPGMLDRARAAVSSIMGGGGNPEDVKTKIDIHPDAKSEGKFVLILDSGEESTEENPNPKIFEGLSEGEKDQLVKDSGLLEDGKDNVIRHDGPYDFPDPSTTPE